MRCQIHCWQRNGYTAPMRALYTVRDKPPNCGQWADTQPPLANPICRLDNGNKKLSDVSQGEKTNGNFIQKTLYLQKQRR